MGFVGKAGSCRIQILGMWVVFCMLCGAVQAIKVEWVGYISRVSPIGGSCFIALIRYLGEVVYKNSGIIGKYMDVGRIRWEWVWRESNITFLFVGVRF